MPIKVVDALAVGALLFNEPAADDVAAQLRGCDLAAPTLLPFEVASIAVKKIARHGETWPMARLFNLFERLAVRMVAVDHAAVVELALKTGLTAYDASYLWLATRLNADLVTLDKALAAARR